MHVELLLHLPRDAASVPAVRKICRQTMASLGVPDEQADDVVLALSEACGNVIRHGGNDHDYDVAMRFNGAECCIVVRNHGATDVIADPTTASELAESGRGMALMAALMDTLSFQPGDNGTTVELIRHLDIPESSVLAALL